MKSTVSSRKYAPLFAHYFEATMGRKCLLSNIQFVSCIRFLPHSSQYLICASSYSQGFLEEQQLLWTCTTGKCFCWY